MSTARTVALSEMNLRGTAVVTASTTVTADDSGVIFISNGSGAVTFTLPAIALGKGKMFIFINRVDQNMTIASAGSLDNIVAFHDVAADSVAFSTSSEKIGGAMLIVGDGTYWYAMNMSAGANTVTVA